MKKYKNAAIALTLSVFNCQNEILPKQDGYLSLNYPESKYQKEEIPVPFTFELNKNSNVNQLRGTKDNTFKTFEIEYPKLKANVFINYSYFSEKDHLKKLILDAQKLTDKHNQVADAIYTEAFENKELRTFGIINKVTGNAASPIQFYVTDSLKHFINGSVYFNVKPNYDSILPAINYLEKDVKTFIGTLKWK